MNQEELPGLEDTAAAEETELIINLDDVPGLFADIGDQSTQSTIPLLPDVSHLEETRLSRSEIQRLQELNYSNELEMIRQKIGLRRIPALKKKDRDAALATSAIIKSGRILKWGLLRAFSLKTAPMLFQTDSIPKPPEKAVTALNNATTSIFEKYQRLFLDPKLFHEGLLGMSKREHQLKSRFDNVQFLTHDVSQIKTEEIVAYVQQSLLGKDQAMPWEDSQPKVDSQNGIIRRFTNLVRRRNGEDNSRVEPPARLVRDYQLIKHPDEVTGIKYTDGKWSQALEATKQPVVVVRYDEVKWGQVDQDFYNDIQKLLDQSTTVILVGQIDTVPIVKEQNGIQSYLQILSNHDVQGIPIKRLGSQLAEKLGGVQKKISVDVRQELLDRADRRYNGPGWLEDGAIKSVAFSKNEVEQIKRLHDSFNESLRGTFKDEAPQIKISTFLQLLLHEAAGVDGKNITGGILQWSPRLSIQLDQIAVTGNLMSLKKLILSGGSNDLDKRKTKIEQILNLKDPKKSNIVGIIGATLEQLKDKTEDLWKFAFVVRNSGAMRALAGQVCTSYMPEGFKLRVSSMEDDVALTGFDSTAGPFDEMFAIMPSIEKGKLVGLTVRVKANWQSQVPMVG